MLRTFKCYTNLSTKGLRLFATTEERIKLEIKFGSLNYYLIEETFNTILKSDSINASWESIDKICSETIKPLSISLKEHLYSYKL